jgi:hypothetical protein
VRLRPTLAKGLLSRDTVDMVGMEAALTNYLRDMSLASILYKKVRSGVIHGVQVQINEDRFFSEDRPYWEPYEFEFGDFLLVSFPAKFLLNVLKQSLKTLRQQFIASRRIAPAIYWFVFDDDGLKYLEMVNDELLENTDPLPLRHRSRGSTSTA